MKVITTYARTFVYRVCADRLKNATTDTNFFMEKFEIRDAPTPKRLMDKIKKFKWTPAKIWLVSSMCIVAATLILVLVPLSYSYVEWNQFALKRNTFTNQVDYNQVYGNGRYYWGLQVQPATFQSMAVLKLH